VSIFSGEPTTPTTEPPRPRATWIAAVPTPPAAAVTSTRLPGSTRTCRVSGMKAVRNVRRNDAPSANVACSGSGTTCARSTATSSAYPPPPDVIAMTRVPSSSSPATSEPRIVGSSGICG
jgi:hypothetical protein